MNPQFLPSLFVQSLVAPTTLDLADKLISKHEHKQKREKSSRWILDERLSPAELYVYLKARFGPPNGVTMIVRGPHSDNFIQWHYTLESNSSTFEIFGMNTRTEFWISDYPTLGDNDWTGLVEAIKGDFSTFGPKMKEVRKQLEKWQLFYNPYHRLDRIVKKNYKELSEILKSNRELPTDPPAFPVIYSSEKDTGHKRIKEFISRMQAFHGKYTRMLELSTSLRLICPVWAEAFINFLIFALTRNEIKDDARLYEDFVRKEIDVRVKLLHINCVGFAKAIDTSDQRYKDFHSLMNDRNDLLHGNIDPKKLSYETVYFDKMIPLFTEPQGFARNSLGVSLKGVEPATTLQRVQLVESFIEFILSHLDTSYKEQISLLLSKRELGWRSDTKKMGVLFPDFILEGYAG
jgi:hypothetical protein